jgi:hypothetical protein
VTSTSRTSESLHDASAGWSLLHQQHGVSPTTHDGSQQDHQTTFVGLEYWAFDLSGCHDQLLLQQGVLGDELVSRPSQIAQQPDNHR